MTREIVADTGPLIALARVERLGLLEHLYGRIVVPPAVYIELAIGSGRPGARALADAFTAGWIAVQTLPYPGAGRELERLLGPGEAEAIALAEQENAHFLLIDDARGRRIARHRGIHVIGVPGMLLVGKSQGAIAAVSPVLDALSNAGYRLSPRLVASVLAKAEE